MLGNLITWKIGYIFPFLGKQQHTLRDIFVMQANKSITIYHSGVRFQLLVVFSSSLEPFYSMFAFAVSVKRGDIWVRKHIKEEAVLSGKKYLEGEDGEISQKA